ncbi:MAG: adenosylhomocysteinase [Actinomycetota bacterium]
MQKVKDISLADTIGETEEAWWRILMPVTTRIGDAVSGTELHGRTIACFQHIRLNTVPTLLPLAEAGARVRVAAVNPDSTDDVAAAMLAKRGVDVWGWSRMADADVQEGLKWLLSEPADAASDMGGELIAGMARRGYEPIAALEATTSGLHRLAGMEILFPVYEWNSLPLKDRLHNRHHVGLTAWPAFSAVTGLAIHGRSVLVVGFGPVGRGVALAARALGAVVSVAEVDPVRANEAQHHGCRDVPLDEGLESAAIVVTATGRENVLGPDQLCRLRSGAILVNVGHSNREIDVAWLNRQPHETVRESVDRYLIDDREVFLVNRGSLVNLAPGAGTAMDEYFDPFAALMLHGIAWILGGGDPGASAGLQPYPPHLEAEVAELTRRVRT